MFRHRQPKKKTFLSLFPRYVYYFCDTIHFAICINDLPGDIICNVVIYVKTTIVYSKCDKNSDLWHQLLLASALESDLKGRHYWLGKKRLVGIHYSKNLSCFI